MRLFKSFSSKKLLLIILTAALALRIYMVFFYAESWYSADSYAYLDQAENLLKGGYPTYFPNGFPLIISLFLFISGSSDSAAVLVIFLNIILSTLIVYFIYRISVSFYGRENLALLAALIVGIYPNQINYVRFIMSDLPAAFLLVLSLFLLQKSRYKLSAFAAGFTSIIRTAFLPLGILFSFYLFMKKNYRNSTMYLIFFLLPVCSLLVYGFVVSSEITLGKNTFHNLTLLSNNYEGNYVDAESSVSDYVSYLINDPERFIKDRFISLWELWGPFTSITKWEKSSFHYRLLAGLRFPLLLLAMYGFLKLPQSNERTFVGLAVLILTVVHFFYFSNPRHSLIVEPLLAILAVKGLSELYCKLFNKQRRNLARQK